jgi:quercetin dioxygenase-like cupin family protein
MSEAIVSRLKDYKYDEFEWGNLAWFCNDELQNSKSMTVGRCVIKPGQANPRHYHPNCDEILHVLEGKILHSMEGGKTVEMSAGDTISIPVSVPHNAKNIGDKEAVMLICFSSAERKTVGE